MTSCAGSPVTNVAQRLIKGALREVEYFCCFNTHFESFENKREQLVAIRIQVLKDIEDAKERDETRVDDNVQRFLNETDVITEEDTETRKKWFHGWCPDCIWRYRQGKKLAKKMQDVEDLIGRSYEFQRVAYHAKIASFIDFESRKPKFKELVQALENGNYYMIGLQGLGGVGKTTLAKKVRLHAEESKAFQKVIFTTVSKSPLIKKIQGDIARQLGLSLQENEEAGRAKILRSKIANDTGRLLIILDNVWEKLELRDIGIPFGIDHMNCCVLVTTRHVEVCRAMGCQVTIHLQSLTNQETFNLFMTHANDDDFSSCNLNGVAQDIVEECGGLPVVIVAMARTLRHWRVGQWKTVLTILRNSQPSVDIDEGLIKTYKCLKLCYENLRNEEAKKLFLLCSLFPEDYEIPVSLFIRLGIGAGIFGDVDKYCQARSQALAATNELIGSYLLFEVEKTCVKMHDLVREVALGIAKEDTQVIMNTRITPKSNLRFLSWSGNDLPRQFHGTKLEILLLMMKGCVKLEDAKAIFEEMGNLKVLVLCCDVENRLTLSLQSFLLLKNIRTLILSDWKLANISILGNIQSLQTLELNNCSLTELPKETEELKKLKLLGLRRCSIGTNNPFEVIERCSQLEELYFVENGSAADWKPESNTENVDVVSQDISPPAFQMFSIACSGLEYLDDDNRLLKCFNTEHVKNLISGALLQYLVEKAEVLELGGKEETRWRRSLVPDIIPIMDGVMDDLVKLCLYEWYVIEYLIDAKGLLHSDVTVFSKLVELHMRDVYVTELCHGPTPAGFLKQLQVLKIWRCERLCNIFDGNLKLPHLKVFKLEHCPRFGPSVFKPSVARSLARLEELVVEDCNRLRSLIEYDCFGEEMADVDHRNHYDPLFPRLKTLKINACEELELVLPQILAGDLPLLLDLSVRCCPRLRCIFSIHQREDQFLHQQTMLPWLTTVDLYMVPSLITIFRAHSLTTKKHKGASKSEIEETINIERPVIPYVGSKYGLNLHNLQQITITGSRRLKALFSTSTWRSLPQLSKLCLWDCDELRNVVEDDSKDDGDISYSSIFPKLEDLEIRRCMNVEFVFPSPDSGGFPKVKHLIVREAPKLKYIFGKYLTNENESNEVQVDLSALETLSLTKVPNIINICAKKHNVLRLPSLRDISLDDCQELSARPFPNLTLYWKPEAAKDSMRIIMPQQKLTSLAIEESTIEEVFSFGVYVDDERVVDSNLKFMRLKYLRELRHICRGGKYSMSLHNLSELEIESCRKLRVVFSASMSKSLRQLSDLRIKDCPELVHLIEEDDEENAVDHLPQRCFPNLRYIDIERCHSLKCLFSISTFRMLPKLQSLQIVDALQLEQVFRCKQDDIQKIAGKDVCPTLSSLTLIRLPRLVTVCGWTNFQTVQYAEVVDCPIYQDAVAEKELPSAQEMPYVGETSASPNFPETTEETLVEIEATCIVPASEKQALKTLPVDSGLRTPSIHLKDEQTISEPTVQRQHEDHGHEMKGCQHRSIATFIACLRMKRESRNETGVIGSIEGDEETKKEVGKLDPAQSGRRRKTKARRTMRKVRQKMTRRKIQMGSQKIIVLRLNLRRDKEKRKALKAAAGVPGIDAIALDMNGMTVIGTADPVLLVGKLRKLRPADIISVDPFRA